ncbi:hypothetical protein BDQ12DRAFT_766844 [Crucibulum laeve]|uniref:DUF6534 domain-containing protein n=1 Tax=Crucibulum laeve TaxID=68775 RepID=A0A5C3LNB5_9AGAR|nr:hypothetical protein BDQ12DRAFT_766844 [Crucibulum laeve]
MASTPFHINLDSKLGAAFIGNLVAAILYGITCLQTFIYYSKFYKDGTVFKSLIYSLWCLDSLQLALISHSMYFYMVSNYGNLLVMVRPNWYAFSPYSLTSLIVVRHIVTGVGAHRFIERLNHTYIYRDILTYSLRSKSVSIMPDGHMLLLTSLPLQILRAYVYMYLSLGSAVVADALIALSLCVSLSRNRTGFRRTDSIVNTLMLYAINSKLLKHLPSVSAAACFITYTIWPEEFTFIAIYFCLSKLYVNSLLATLNGRESLQERVMGTTEIYAESTSFAFTAASRPREERASKDSFTMGNLSSVSYLVTNW